MPEYLAPGVYVEEASFRSKRIEGVRTGTAGFVGPTERGPVDRAPELLTSLADFERHYGSCGDVRFPDGTTAVNYVAHAVRNFFDNGGSRLFVARIAEPVAGAYAAALARLAEIDEIGLVAAPGYSRLEASVRVAVEDALIAHAGAPGAYRFAVLDAPPKQTPREVVVTRQRFDTPSAALYYPWVVATNPAAASCKAIEISLPPSGFVCGIYARTDIQRGVWKAPANEAVKGALRFERDVGAAEQDLLNPEGVNCLRSLPGRGLLVFGARTASSDPEWKYVNVRRLFIFLEHSIQAGTQWAVFEPNGQALWDKVRSSIGDFLDSLWRAGALLGASPEKAYFVRCDRSTMTQNDLDQGRLVCVIGVAPLRPAEFVIFRIGQKTADAAS